MFCNEVVSVRYVNGSLGYYATVSSFNAGIVARFIDVKTGITSFSADCTRDYISI